MVHFRSRGIGLEQCIQLMKNSRNGTIWFHGEREKNTKLFFYHYLIFQVSQSNQSPFIQLATNSPWSHCGVIVEKGGKVYVLEASNVVKLTPLKKWISRGKFGKYKRRRVLSND